MRKLCIIILCVLSAALHAQTAELRGKVTDGESIPLEGATVGVYIRDSVLTTGCISNEKGEFALKGLKPDSYLLKISYVGYMSEDIRIDNLAKRLDVGTVVLHPDNRLEEVVVTGSSKRYGSNRQIMIPTETQLNISSNGWGLLQNLQLARIKISPMNNQITTQDGKNVILQINGVKVEKEEIMSLRPMDVVRVEYSDQPEARYQAGAVINYVVRKRESGGYIALNGNQSLSSLGVKQYSMSTAYNWKKSQLGVIVGYNESRAKWTRENEYQYNFPDNAFTQEEEGQPTWYKDKTLNATVKYTLYEADKYMFNATLRNKFNHIPNQFSDRQGIIRNSLTENESFVSDFSSWKENTPSLDLYFQRNLPGKQLLMVNVVGTLVHTHSNHDYMEKDMATDAALSTIHSFIEGDKQSVIAEGVYEKQFENSRLSTGLNHTQSYTENRYAGNVEADVNLRYMESYLFADYVYSKDKFTLSAGLSGKFTRYSQSGNRYKKFHLQPRLRLQYTPLPHLTLRYHADVASSAPSLADLNHTEQQIDRWQVKRGNPALKNSMNYNQNLLVSFNNKYVDIELAGYYIYNYKPIFETVFCEGNKMIHFSENQKGRHRIRVESTFNLHPFGQYISLSVTPGINRYVIYGNSYTHTYTNYYVRASLLASYKRWFLNAQMNTRDNLLAGETIEYTEKFHSIGAGYNAANWSLSAGVFMPFMKDYSQASRNLSKVMPSYSKIHTGDLSGLFYIAGSINLNLGRSFKAQGQKRSNSDTGASVLSGGKASM